MKNLLDASKHKFDKATYYKYDKKSKEAVIRLLKSFGLNAFVNPDRYGVDIIVDEKDKRWCVEVEHRGIWTKDKFPFKTVTIPGRKFHLAIKDVYFAAVNNDFTKVAFVRGDIAGRNFVVKDTKSTQQETFMEVDINEFTIFDIPKE